MKNSLIIFILLFFIISSCTNPEDEIIGEWKLNLVRTNQKISNKKNYSKAIEQLKNSTSITFKKDKTFKAVIWGDTLSGIWNMEQNGKILSIFDKISNKKTNTSIKKINNKEIVLVEKQDSIVMELTFVKK